MNFGFSPQLLGSGRTRQQNRVAVVWVAWLALTLAALAYVDRFGRNVPSWDDWDIVPTMTGHQPITANWLWSQHNEHRLPVSRLILLALLKPGSDLRAAMVCNVLLMALVSAALIQMAARLRGRLALTEAFFPLAMLHVGQGVNFIWAWQLEFFLSTAFALAFLMLVVRRPFLETRTVVCAGVLMILLAGTGAHGVALIPPMVCWLVGAAVLQRRAAGAMASRPQVSSAVVVGAAVLGLGLVALYFWGYENVPHHPVSSVRRATVLAAIKALAMSFGPAAREAWPVSGVVILWILAATAGPLALTWARWSRERVRAWGLFCFIGGIAALALALGTGRDGFEPRYVAIVFPILCGVYFAWSLYSTTGAGRAARWALLLIAAGALWPNTRFGLTYAEDLSEHLDAFERDMVAGTPTTQLIARHHRYLHPNQSLLLDYLPMLRGAGVGSFVDLRDDDAFEVVEISPNQLEVTGGERDGNTIRHGGQATIAVTLPQTLRVAGVSMEYESANAIERQPMIEVRWRGEEETFVPDARFYRSSPTGDRANWETGSYARVGSTYPMVQFWVWQSIAELQIAPDYTPGTFTIRRLVLLVPRDVRHQVHAANAIHDLPGEPPQ